MVDLGTALAAAQADDRRRRGAGDKKKAKLEPFDPVNYVEKEKADTVSMWLVIVFAVTVGLVMRFLVMPMMDGPGSILWSLPLLLLLVIPTLHRIILARFAEHYTKGNWFRASMLYIFTWLAVGFLVVNPPIGDIAAPEVAGQAWFVDDDGWAMAVNTIELDNVSSTAESTKIVLAVRDNVETANVAVLATLTSSNGETNLQFNGTVEDFVDGADSAVEMANTSKISDKDRDLPIKFDIGALTPGAYTFTITLSEDGDPWVNSETKTWEFSVRNA